jgi:probable rRNA maturation factor
VRGRNRVHLQNRQRKLKLDSARLRAWAAAVLAGEAVAPGSELEIVFVRDPDMRALNARHRGRDATTDVLSFVADPTGWPAGEPRLIGSVVISVDQAAEQAREHDLPVAEEIRRLLAHGLLHLLGYDHATSRDRARMRRRETRYCGSATERR